MLHLYGSPLSVPCNKVRYIANYLHIPYEFHTINLGADEHHKPEFLKINPFGKVPAIDDNGFKLGESNAIIRYLAEKQTTPLYPKDLQQRATIDQWLDFNSHHIASALGKIMFNTHFYKIFGITKDERSLQDGRHYLGQYLPMVEKQLSQHPFVTGKTLSLADLALISSLDVCELCQVDLSSYTHITAWRKKLINESFYRDCHESYTTTFNKIVSKAGHKDKA